jgi:hypothetical protein
VTHRLSLAAALLTATGPAAAQGLPPYSAVNPVLTSRSGLYFQPYVEPTAGWRVRLLLDYASAVEFVQNGPGRFVLDAELLRLDLTVTRDWGAGFAGLSAGLNGAYNGFLDGFLDWYHDLTGLRVPARESRPRNVFAYDLELADGRSLARTRSSAFLGDLRLLAGHRHTPHWQSTFSVTLPTSNGPAGYGRKVPSASAITTVRAPLDGRVEFEGSLGVGMTPRHGPIEDLQRILFASASAGVRYRFWGRQAAFVNLFYQSPSYRGTGIRALDQRELTLDYGFLLRARKGPEWLLGMTEDVEPKGPAIDLSFRIGARW